MTRGLLILLIALGWRLYAIAQFSSEKIISTETLGAWTVYAGDIDGDGMIDVASANHWGESITWFKNLGNGQFGSLIFIADLDNPLDISGADIDGDGDIDILATAVFSDLVVWYENLDGLGAFSSQKIISDETININDVQAGDIDNDGDIDLVTGSSSSGVAWHENTDGLGNFAPKQIINDNISNARAVSITDVDNDGDLDVVAVSSSSFTLSWYENLDGEGDFGPIQILAGNALTKSAVFAEDIDGDGDNDLVTTTNAENKVEWRENLGGAGNFASPQVITTEAQGAISVFVTDLDNDGDMDVLSGSAQDAKVAWYENMDGQGSFGTQQIISTNAQAVFSVQAADLDNDGDMDALSASRNDNKVAWYENFTVLSIEDVRLSQTKIYPNPARDTLFIESATALNGITILDVAGKQVYTSDKDLRQINVNHLAKGMYFLKLESENSHFLKKLIID